MDSTLVNDFANNDLRLLVYHASVISITFFKSVSFLKWSDLEPAPFVKYSTKSVVVDGRAGMIDDD